VKKRQALPGARFGTLPANAKRLSPQPFNASLHARLLPVAGNSHRHRCKPQCRLAFSAVDSTFFFTGFYPDLPRNP
jgi:hypothetical protein